MANKLRILLILAAMLNMASGLMAQTRNVLIYLNDKANNSFSLNQPQQFLSQRSIDRRNRQNLPLTIDDLPVSTAYIGQIRNTGARVRHSLKWQNAVLVEATQAQLNNINSLPFIRQIQSITQLPGLKKVKRKYELQPALTVSNLASLQAAQNQYQYGAAQTQIAMIEADTMHRAGYSGQGLFIAVMDAGFGGANTHAAFGHLYSTGRVKAEIDVVNDLNQSNLIYTQDAHGNNVWGCIGAKLDGQLVGTAPEADFALIRTEFAPSEGPLELAYWCVGLEKADSLGADIVNSSLGYFWFDSTQYNFSNADLDGNTTLISKQASMAFSKGIVVVNSAGNEGNNQAWNGAICAPADASNILAVGAVNSGGNYVSFSSRGPSADQRVKPDVAAMGSRVTTTGSFGANAIISTSGTSFASPLIAGFVAGLWQSARNATALQVMSAVRLSGSQFFNPDTRLGYGIPKYTTARNFLNTILSTKPGAVTAQQLKLFHDKAQQSLIVWGATGMPKSAKLTDLVGAEFIVKVEAGQEPNTLSITLPSHTSSGLYVLRLEGGLTGKVLLQP